MYPLESVVANFVWLPLDQRAQLSVVLWFILFRRVALSAELPKVGLVRNICVNAGWGKFHDQNSSRTARKQK